MTPVADVFHVLWLLKWAMVALFSIPVFVGVIKLKSAISHQ